MGKGGRERETHLELFFLLAPLHALHLDSERTQEVLTASQRFYPRLPLLLPPLDRPAPTAFAPGEHLAAPASCAVHLCGTGERSLSSEGE
eukprot:95635-Hanusia_phi.AAC.4